MRKSIVRAADVSELLHLLTADILLSAENAPVHTLQLPIAGMYVLTLSLWFVPAAGGSGVVADIRCSAFASTPPAGTWSRQRYTRIYAANPVFAAPSISNGGHNVSLPTLATGQRGRIDYRNWVNVPYPSTLSVAARYSPGPDGVVKAGSYLRANLI